jgi:hypothetical protein
LVLCGEFAHFEEAFYHSAVNFTTLAYGDTGFLMDEDRS